MLLSKKICYDLQNANNTEINAIKEELKKKYNWSVFALNQFEGFKNSYVLRYNEILKNFGWSVKVEESEDPTKYTIAEDQKKLVLIESQIGTKFWVLG